jgi:hypothetical protein
VKHKLSPLYLFVQTSHLRQQRVSDSVVEYAIELFGSSHNEGVEFSPEGESRGYQRSTALSQCFGNSLEASSAMFSQ